MSALAEKLREAKALVARGWTQGVFSDGKCYCALGAILYVTGEGDFSYSAAKKPLQDAIGTSYAGGVATWNDAPERTQAEVLAAFDKAIQLAEAIQ